MPSRRLLAIALAAASIGAGCSDDATADRPTCAGSIADAAEQIEASDQLRRLDAALTACGSYDAYVAELKRHPGLIGYSAETYLARRCATLTDIRMRNTPTCRIAHPPTTPPVATMPDIVYAAATLDGRVIELRPSPAVPFTGDVPAVVQDTVDIAVAQGCPGVIAQRDLWAGRAASEAAGSSVPGAGPSPADIASVSAQHAIHVAVWIGCENPAGTTVPAP